MRKTPKRHTVTAALPYANGPIHIGHMAGVYIPADIYVRYLRAQEKDVAFVCGSDEHGVPITLRARQEKTTPQAIVDKYHQLIKQSFEDFGISFDIYSRTSSITHRDTASDFFKELFEKGVFQVNESEQYYDQEEQQFLADRYIKGTCPRCSYEEAYGDQCEKCGSSLSPSDLINPVSALSGTPPVLKKTKHWYLPLNQFEPWLKKWILQEHKEWKTNVYGQCKSWLDQGLQPRAVTRDLDWGVPVPLENAQGKVLYVWFDAPIGYISATKEWAQKNDKNWKLYWKDDETSLIHFIGKDNIVFHCIIFPAMLKAHGELILPQNVPANEFLNLEGKKISTSRNWAVWLHEYLQDFPDKEDTLRYTLTANAPETKDNDFTWKDFQAKNNSELVAILGNFINRVLTLTNKYYDGKVPPVHEYHPVDQTLITFIKEAPQRVGESIEHFRFREALQYFMELARQGNKFLADTEPWKLIKTDPQRVETILHICLQIVANLTILGEPFLPKSAKKLAAMLSINRKMTWADAGRIDLLPIRHQIEKPSLLFEKIEDSSIQYQVEKLKKQMMTNTTVKEDQQLKPLKETVSFEDFVKLDLRTATILDAEKVEKSNKLLKLTVDTGLDKRTIVSGIAEHYSPEEIIGKQVCILANLAPRKIFGITSQGMIMMAEDVDGKLSFVKPDQKLNEGMMIS